MQLRTSQEEIIQKQARIKVLWGVWLKHGVRACLGGPSHGPSHACSFSFCSSPGRQAQARRGRNACSKSESARYSRHRLTAWSRAYPFLQARTRRWPSSFWLRSHPRRALPFPHSLKTELLHRNSPGTPCSSRLHADLPCCNES